MQLHTPVACAIPLPSHLLISERPLETNPYLQMRGESQLRAKHGFERAAGWRFGFVFGALVVLFTYVPDAFLLWSWHAEYWWVKLALASVTIFPLAIVTGGIAGYLNWLLKLPVWALFGVLAAWCAVNIPFDGARIVLQNLDRNLQIVPFLPVPAATGDAFGMLALLGAVAGIIVGGLQTLLVTAAWERSTEDYRMTLSGWGLMLLAAPLALGFALLFDLNTQLVLRTPLDQVQAVVVSGLNDPATLDPQTMERDRALAYSAGRQWANKFDENYTMHLVAAEISDGRDAYVDVSFDNGFTLRCKLAGAGQVPLSCIDLSTEYARYISEFVPRGSFRCGDCEARVSQQAAEWRAANARELTNTDRITIDHGAGASVRVRVSPQTGGSRFECLISGANPVIVEQCRNL